MSAFLLSEETNLSIFYVGAGFSLSNPYNALKHPCCKAFCLAVAEQGEIRKRPVIPGYVILTTELITIPEFLYEFLFRKLASYENKFNFAIE
jgi:hypothetical protein